MFVDVTHKGGKTIGGRKDKRRIENTLRLQGQVLVLILKKLSVGMITPHDTSY